MVNLTHCLEKNLMDRYVNIERIDIVILTKLTWIANSHLISFIRPALLISMSTLPNAPIVFEKASEKKTCYLHTTSKIKILNTLSKFSVLVTSVLTNSTLFKPYFWLNSLVVASPAVLLISAIVTPLNVQNYNE